MIVNRLKVKGMVMTLLKDILVGGSILFIGLIISFFLISDAQAIETGRDLDVGVGWNNIMKMLGALTLVVALVIIGGKIANQKVMKMGGDDLKIISSIPVGQKERLVLVQADDEKILVGVGPGFVRHVTNIHTDKKFSMDKD